MYCKGNTTMKNFIITIAVLISTLSVNAQTKIGSNFNEKFADSLLFEKINQKRVSLGFTPFYKSKVVSKEISQRNVDIMFSKNLLHHPGFKWEGDSVLTKKVVKIHKEYKKINKDDKNLNPETNVPYTMVYMEVALGGDNLYYYETYEELIDVMINGWYNSLSHRVILLGSDASFTLFKETSFMGVSIKVNKEGKYYSAVNIVSF